MSSTGSSPSAAPVPSADEGATGATHVSQSVVNFLRAHPHVSKIDFVERTGLSADAFLTWETGAGVRPYRLPDDLKVSDAIRSAAPASLFAYSISSFPSAVFVALQG